MTKEQLLLNSIGFKSNCFLYSQGPFNDKFYLHFLVKYIGYIENTCAFIFHINMCYNDVIVGIYIRRRLIKNG